MPASLRRGVRHGRAFVDRVWRGPRLLVVEGNTYGSTADALADAYRVVRPGGRIAIVNAPEASDARRAVEGFRFEYGALPLRHVTAETVEVTVPPPKDPAFHFGRALREKWREVPVARNIRAFSDDLARLDDRELLERWELHRLETLSPQVRGWYQERYRDELRGKRVLDFGCGFGVDGIFFAEHGAEVTFADIVRSNLEILSRVAKARRLSIQTYLVDDFFEYSFERPFDVIMAIGSLINAPLPFTQRQLDALLPWLAPGGTFLLLGYPRERFEQLGVRNGREFGMLTDGERTPWCEWLDRGRVELLFGSNFDVTFERNFGVDDTEFNWFELVHRGASW